MGLCLKDVKLAEPSSDFPTTDDLPRCAGRSRLACAAMLAAGALLVAAVGYVLARRARAGG